MYLTLLISLMLSTIMIIVSSSSSHSDSHLECMNTISITPSSTTLINITKFSIIIMAIWINLNPNSKLAEGNLILHLLFIEVAEFLIASSCSSLYIGT